MPIYYATFDSATSSGETDKQNQADIAVSNLDYVAIGTFTGGNGLPANHTSLNSLTDFEAFIDDLKNKGDETTNVGIDVDIDGSISGGFFVKGALFGPNHIHVAANVTASGEVWGGVSSDFLQGGAGADTIFSSSGGDTLVGRSGDDLFKSLGDHDVIVGGAGADTFEFEGFLRSKVAKIVDLSEQDTIDLSKIAAGERLDGFHVVDRFDGHGGEIVMRYHSSQDKTIIQIHLDGSPEGTHTIVTHSDLTSFDNFVS